MRWFRRAVFPSVLMFCAATLVLRAADGQTTGGAVDLLASTHPPQQFAGLWAYNADESVNAATGRPERLPRIAIVRVSGAGAAGSGPVVASPLPVGGKLGVRSFDGDSQWPTAIGPTVAMLHENRALIRDLLEIPEALTIRIAPRATAVTFVDDLDREQTYDTDGSRQPFQIGAARFNAAAAWNGSALEKHIDADDGFRMSELYLLSQDAQRMFVIVRVTSTHKGAGVMGVNRVYDRVDPSMGPAGRSDAE